MKAIILGVQNTVDYQTVRNAINTFRHSNKLVIDEIVVGGGRTVDPIGAQYAREYNLPCSRFPANRRQYGRNAGMQRNKQMAQYGDILIAFPNGGPGTMDMIRRMYQAGKPVFVINL
jgi:hypothetical protein